MSQPDWRSWGVHPIAFLMPSMTEEEYRGLRDDIAANGQRDPIERFEGKILDGRHRHRACVDLDIKPDYVNLPASTNPVTYVISKNLHRRHLTVSQRAVIAVGSTAALKLEAKRASGKQVNWEDLLPKPPLTLQAIQDRTLNANLQSPQVTLKNPEVADLAKAADVSVRSIRQAQVVQNKAIPEVAEAVAKRDVNIARAAQIATLPVAEQPAALAEAIAQTGTQKPRATPEEKAAEYDEAITSLLQALEPFEKECGKQLSRKPRTGTSSMTLHETTARNVWDAAKALRGLPKPKRVQLGGACI